VSVAFDTLKFARALQGKAKLTAEQAEGIAEAFADATGEQLATKSDLSALGAAMKSDLSALAATTKSDLLALGAAMKSDLSAVAAMADSNLRQLGADLRAELARHAAKVAEALAAHDSRFVKIEGELVLLKWMVGFNLAATLAVFFLLLRH
jgi:hypothetical protein